MASDRVRTVPLPLRLAFSAVVFAALVWALAELLAHTHLYATALIVAALAGLVLADIYRTAGRADVILSQILDRLTGAAMIRAVA